MVIDVMSFRHVEILFVVNVQRNLPRNADSNYIVRKILLKH